MVKQVRRDEDLCLFGDIAAYRGSARVAKKQKDEDVLAGDVPASAADGDGAGAVGRDDRDEAQSFVPAKSSTLVIDSKNAH